MRELARWVRPGLALAGLALLGVSLALQFGSGAHDSEFGAHPDEAAHFISGLMVRDYLLDGLPGNPMAFAQNYYEHYPKVAIGHYPPGFYVAQGIWMLPAASPSSALTFMAFLTAGVATLICLIGFRFLPPPAAIGAAAIFVLLPFSQRYTSLVMSDMLVALLELSATWAFALFLM